MMKTTLHTIKSILLLIAISMLSASAISQEAESVTVPLSNPGQPGELRVSLIEGSITVKSHADTDKVIVSAVPKSASSRSWKRKSNKSREGKRSGLTRVTANSIEFSVREEDNKVRVSASPNQYNVDYEILVPETFSLNLKALNNGNIYVENVNGYHEVSNTNGKITMKDIGGAVVADALNQSIVISFTYIESDTAMMFSSLNGDIDISFPSNLKANVWAQADNGDVYTDFELKADDSAARFSETKKDGVYQVKKIKGITGVINGGGSSMKFKTLNGDIMIRSN